MSDGRTWGTVIGGIIGYFVPVIGWAAGAAIGGAVGGLLEPTKKVEQGRIDDLKVSVSQYGAGIPETWGNNVPPATWVWATDVIEIGQTQGGGKGGGGTEVTQYRQFIHGYLVLGRTPPVGSTIQIRKAWVDGKLTYDASSGLSVAQALASEENPFAQISLHPGWEDQIPHPIMEFYEGIGNTPAYRGVVGVFVFGLECPGGRIPQLSFEICVNPSTETVKQQFAEIEALGTSYPAFGVVKADSVWHYVVSGNDFDGDYELQVQYAGPDYVVRQKTIKVPGVHYGLLPIPLSGDGPPAAIRLRTSSSVSLTGTWYIDKFDLEAGSYGPILTYVPGVADGRIAPASGGFDETTSIYAIFNSILNDVVFITSSFGVVRSAAAVPGTGGPVTIKGEIGYALSIVSGDLVVYAYSAVDGSLLHTFTGPAALSATAISWAGLHPGDDALYVWFRDSPKHNLYSVDYSTGAWSLLSDEIDTDPPEKIGNYPTTLYADSRRALIGPSSEVALKHYYTYCRMGVVTPLEAPVDEVIESQCERVGLSGKIDASTIDDTVWGYTFNKSPASARNNIAPLLTYAGVAQVEEDGIIRFFHRGDKTPVATISYDELGCTEDGQEPGDPFPLSRTQEAECPRSVTVQYVNPFFDYQTSTETARRIVTDSELDETVTLDVAMTPDKAATIAHRTLYERWIARDTRSFKVSRKFAALSPGDVVTIEYPRGTTGNYMLAKVNDTGALIEAECVPADAELLTQSIPGTNGYTGQQIAPLPPQTRLILGDWAILRDTDNNAGLYAVMSGFGNGWPGAQIYAGEDAGSLQEKGTVTSAAVQGFCESAPADYQRGNVDEYNVITVRVVAGSLTTITRAELLFGTSNVAAIGAQGRWEIIKFQRADDLGNGLYLLSGLLRGLQGTEWAASLHEDGDDFALLSEGGVLRVDLDPAWINQRKTFKAVTLGRRLESASPQNITNTAEGLRPLSPSALRKAFNSDDIVLTWSRRSRLFVQWWFGNVPLGEESERYEIDIFSDNAYTTVKRTLASTSPTVTYTSAQQVADFGSNQTTVYVRIYQMSGTVGRGHPLQREI